MPLSLLSYVGVGILLMLYVHSAVPPAEALVGRTFLFMPYARVGLMLLFWSLLGAYWFREVTLEEGRGKAPGGAKLVGVFAALSLLWLVACAVKPVLSTDVGLYVAAGRQIVVHGQSPYLLPLDAILPDPFLLQMSKWWLDQSALYGPIALGSFALVCSLSIPTLFGNIAAMKVFLALVLGASGYVVWRAYEGDRFRLSKTLAWVAHPMMIQMVIVDAHLDIMLVFFLLLCTEAARRERPGWAATWLAAACAVKIFAVILAPPLFFWFVARGQRHATWFAASFALSFACWTTISGLGELSAVPMLDRLGYFQPSVVPQFFRALGMNEVAGKQASDLVFVLACLILYVALVRGRLAASPGLVVAVCFVAFLLTRPYYQPWYTVNFWPLLSLATRTGPGCFKVTALWMVAMPLYWMEPPLRDIVIAPFFLLALYWTWKDLSAGQPHGKTLVGGST